MPSSAVRTFTDPDDYAVAIRATTAELTVTGRGQFAAKLIRIDLHRLWMQRFSDNLPRIFHSAMVPGRAIITFPTQSGPSLFWSGVEWQPTDITRHSDGEDFASALIQVGQLWCNVAAGRRYGVHRGDDGRMRPDAAA